MKLLALGTALTAAAVSALSMAPTAHADMTLGNYQVLTNRYTDASWIWFVTTCTETRPGCFQVRARPSPRFGAYYNGEAILANGRYTLATDVPDGLRCFGQALPARETWSWDAISLAGTIESAYDVGCSNGPPGVNMWTFALTRF
jgi:hypothetical protein